MERRNVPPILSAGYSADGLQSTSHPRSLSSTSGSAPSHWALPISPSSSVTTKAAVTWPSSGSSIRPRRSTCPGAEVLDDRDGIERLGAQRDRSPTGPGRRHRRPPTLGRTRPRCRRGPGGRRRPPRGTPRDRRSGRAPRPGSGRPGAADASRLGAPAPSAPTLRARRRGYRPGMPDKDLPMTGVPGKAVLAVIAKAVETRWTRPGPRPGPPGPHRRRQGGRRLRRLRQAVVASGPPPGHRRRPRRGDPRRPRGDERRAGGVHLQGRRDDHGDRCRARPRRRQRGAPSAWVLSVLALGDKAAVAFSVARPRSAPGPCSRLPRAPSRLVPHREPLPGPQDPHPVGHTGGARHPRPRAAVRHSRGLRRRHDWAMARAIAGAPTRSPVASSSLAALPSAAPGGRSGTT